MITRLVGIKSKKVIVLKSVSGVVVTTLAGRPKTNLMFKFETADGWSGTYKRGQINIRALGYDIPEMYEAHND